ncbi:MAG: CD225/dispanin family protein [Akkermansia sp.]|nr:CD225/dispanin family protein [Akkermansia sp.]
MPDYVTYYLRKPGEKPMGPLTVDIIEALVKAGELSADYEYSESEQTDEWRPLRELPVLAKASFAPDVLQNTPHVKPATHLGWSILLTILGFFPMGLIAIVKSLKVAEHYAAGRYAEARRASDAVRTICLWNVALTVIVLCGIFIMV